ncbi:putative toxin-antitoxin system toxin component, PIN family [Sutterella massiliensis]|uniref:Toxin-antitoxin system toxin component, PIN family n=1 Tax=Sutterella massiliensis TaxID=1816689 RepID=A0ABS2DQ39_9BURK|nr:putative toxin-antitoxin system toxin component, PIN family [Sutterella massiliensis]MBM6703404.1 putative toxin-antitoxin system toxin component, PIN family [Sutterella massiliensis]
MRVVLDTNVLISALISPHNPPDLILQSWLAGDFELLTSEDQLEEIRRVSRYEHLQPFLQPHRVGLIINRMRSLATIVKPGTLISEEALDPDDNFLIAICEAGSANNLVTGDQRAGLLERRHIGATEVLTAAQFAERYLGWRVQRT